MFSHIRLTASFSNKNVEILEAFVEIEAWKYWSLNLGFLFFQVTTRERGQCCLNVYFSLVSNSQDKRSALIFLSSICRYLFLLNS